MKNSLVFTTVLIMGLLLNQNVICAPSQKNVQQTKETVTNTLTEANRALSGRANLIPTDRAILDEWNDALADVKKFVNDKSYVLNIPDGDILKPLAAMESANKELMVIIKEAARKGTDKAKDQIEDLKRIAGTMEKEGQKLAKVTFRVSADKKMQAQHVLLFAMQCVGVMATKLSKEL